MCKNVFLHTFCNGNSPWPAGEGVALGEDFDEVGVLGAGDVSHAAREPRVAEYGR